MNSTGVMMTAKSVLALGALALTVGVVACSPESPKLVTPPVKKIEKVKNDVTIDFTVPVDILFVVDDSGSMETHQQNLSMNIDLFTRDIKTSTVLDYHIGVITSSNDAWTTDPGNPRPGTNGGLYGTPGFIDRNTPNGDAILKRNLLVGTLGSSSEEFFGPVMKALTAPLTLKLNKGFYRQNASLVVIFITDTEDQSQNTITPASFYKFLVDLKRGVAEKIITYGVFIPTAEMDTCYGEYAKPDRLEAFYALSKGLTFSLCDPAFGTKLAQLGADVVKKVEKVLYLSRTPDPKTIVVHYGTELLPNDRSVGWVYDSERNAIILGQDIDWTTQPSGTKVEVNFEVGTYQKH